MSLITHMNLSRLDLEVLRDALKTSISSHETLVRLYANRGWTAAKEEWDARIAKRDRESAMLVRVESALGDDALKVKS